jgi:hypothetical protein
VAHPDQEEEDPPLDPLKADLQEETVRLSAVAPENQAVPVEAVPLLDRLEEVVHLSVAIPRVEAVRLSVVAPENQAVPVEAVPLLEEAGEALLDHPVVVLEEVLLVEEA